MQITGSVREVRHARSRALYFGFAGLLLVMAAVAIESGRSLVQVAAANSQLRAQSRERDALLDQLRLDIYRAATLLRDHLLETDDNRAASHKAELQTVRAHAGRTIAGFAAIVPAGEREAFNKLQDDLAAYWQSLDTPLRWDAADRRNLGGDYLNHVVLPRRSVAVDLIRQITSLNERDLDAGEEKIRAVESGFSRRVTGVSLVGMLLGLILAAVSIGRTRLLETEADRRYDEAEAARHELSRLSGQLVKAQEEERRRLSRELHDEVGQAMSAILIELRRLESTTAPADPQRQKLASVRGIAETTVGLVRNMALLLRPSMLDDLGLVAALRWQAREVSRRTGLNVQVSADEIAEDPPEPIRTCLYRVAQEALQNCVRHARATLVRLEVRDESDTLCLSVRDDGMGFNPRVDKGLGLLGMQERVESLGGNLTIDSRPGAGAAVYASFRIAAGSVSEAFSREEVKNLA
jgi:signal transduction histidine kinase